MKELYQVERIGNTFVVAKSKCGHYYTAMLLGNARVTAWHRTTKKHIQEFYKRKEK